MSDAGGRFVEGWAMARRRAVVASLLAVCLHGGGVGAASPDGQDPCAGAAPALRQAAEALDKGQWAEAEGHLRPLQASHASCGGVALGLARLRAARGDPAEAERLFERATSLTPDDAVAHALFAQYWLSRGQRARADYESSLALSLDPDCPEALVVAGQILGLKGQAARRLPGAAEGRAIWARATPRPSTSSESSCSGGSSTRRPSGSSRRRWRCARPTPVPSTTWLWATKRWAKPSRRTRPTGGRCG